MDARKHIDYYDTLRVMAMVAVVAIHIATPTLKMAFKANNLSADWYTGDIYLAMTRFAVTMFLMLTGATMLGREHKYKDFIKKRLTRIFIPFLVFSVGYIVFKLHFDRPQPHVENLSGLLGWVGDKYMECGLSQHFWYVYMLLVLYPIIPLAQQLISMDKGHRGLDIALGVWAVYLVLFHSSPLSPFALPAPEAISKENIFSAAGLIYLGCRIGTYLTFFGYMLLGYRLSTLLNNMEKRDLRRWKAIAAVVYAASVAFCAAVCARMSLGKLNMAALGYMHINTMMQTIAVFVIVAGTDISQAQSKAGRAIRSIRNSISECSYGIYLLHIMVISALWSIKIYWRICNPVISIPLLTLGVTLVSWVIIYAIRKIPGGKYITG